VPVVSATGYHSDVLFLPFTDVHTYKVPLSITYDTSPIYGYGIAYN
jgi:hypothetical protein